MINLVQQTLNLDGVECNNKESGIDKIISRFINKTGFTKELFGNEFYSKVNLRKENQKKLVQSLLMEMPFGEEEAEIKEAKISVLRDYLILDLQTKYDTINSDLFKLKNSVKLDAGSGKIGETNVPLFARVEIGGNEWKWKDRVKLNRVGGYLDDYDVEITSKVPLIPKEAKEKARQFIADYFQVVSKACEDPLIGNLILQYSSPSGIKLPGFYISWIPKSSEMNIKLKQVSADPILDAVFLGKNFLIHQWISKNELPYQHYLREFQESNGQKPAQN